VGGVMDLTEVTAQMTPAQEAWKNSMRHSPRELR
jgi:hypothetical protein